MQEFSFRAIDIYIYVTLFGLSAVLLGLLMLPKTRRKENHIFKAIIAMFVVQQLLILGFEQGWLQGHTPSRLSYIITLCYGPMLYMYFRNVSTDLRVDWRYVGLWASLAFFLPFFPLEADVFQGVTVLSFSMHLVLSLHRIITCRAWSKLSHWHGFALGFFTLLTLTFVASLLFVPSDTHWVFTIRSVYFSEILILCLGFLLYNARNPAYFLNLKVSEKPRMQCDISTTGGHAEVSLLIEAIEGNGMHRKADLSRAVLSAETGISINRISELINQHFGVNFPEWINTYRIKEATQLLAEQPQLTIKEIYYQVGFNSKSAFYKAFKNQHGLTPTAYRKNQDTTLS